MDLLNLSYRIQALILSSLAAAALVVIYFIVLPQLMDAQRLLTNTSSETLQLTYTWIMMAYFPCAVALNIFIWLKEGSFEREERRAKARLMSSPGSVSFQNALQDVQRRRNAYRAWVDPLLMLAVGMVFGIIAITILKSAQRLS